MDGNPYQSPEASEDEPLADATISFREFRAQPVTFKLTSRSQHTGVRRQVQQAVAWDIGAENVISIVEHAGAFDAFTVVVWYHVKPVTT